MLGPFHQAFTAVGASVHGTLCRPCNRRNLAVSITAPSTTMTTTNGISISISIKRHVAALSWKTQVPTAWEAAPLPLAAAAATAAAAA